MPAGARRRPARTPPRWRPSRQALLVREALTRDAAAVPDDRRDLADSHHSVGNLLEKTGDLAGALAEQRKYQELMRALAAEHPAVPEYRREPGRQPGWVGALLEQTGDLAGGLAEQRKYQELMRVLAAEHPAVPEYRRELAVSHGRVGTCWSGPATWPGHWPSSGSTRS